MFGFLREGILCEGERMWGVSSSGGAVLAFEKVLEVV